MPETQQLLLAVLTGVGFGFFVVLLSGISHQRLFLLLVGLWFLQSFSQHLLRALDGRDITDELITVAILRLVFAVCAVGTLALLHRRWRSCR